MSNMYFCQKLGKRRLQDLSRVVPSWKEISCLEVIFDVVFEVDFKYLLDRLELVFNYVEGLFEYSYSVVFKKFWHSKQ